MKSIEEIIALMNQTFTRKIIYCREMSQFAQQYSLKFYYGETRFCIFAPKWDVVLKIPRFDNVDDDYSALEVRNYERAVEMGLEKILLPTGLLTELEGGCPIYWQTKFTCSHNQLSSQTQLTLKTRFAKYYRSTIYLKVKDAMPSDRCYSDVWLFRAYQLYGKQFFRKLTKFLMENNIDDLHHSNVGWKNDKPIILDYAGYHES